MSIYKPL